MTILYSVILLYCYTLIYFDTKYTLIYFVILLYFDNIILYTLTILYFVILLQKSIKQCIYYNYVAGLLKSAGNTVNRYVDNLLLKKLNGNRSLAMSSLKLCRNKINVISIPMTSDITERLSCITWLGHVTSIICQFIQCSDCGLFEVCHLKYIRRMLLTLASNGI